MQSQHEPRYLHPGVVIEPLVDRFHAWLHTLAPAPAALALAHEQIPALERLAGCGVAEAATLLERVRHDRADMLSLAAALGQAEAGPGRPGALAGIAETPGDGDARCRLRLLEPMLYRTGAYDERRQSVRVFIDHGTERSYFRGTPRLTTPGSIDLPLPLRHRGLDELNHARSHPTTLAALRDAIELDDAQAARLGTMLGPRPGLAADRHIDGGGRIRYFGHACVVLQNRDAAVVVDPFVKAGMPGEDDFTLGDLPDHIDLVLITHGHPDHLVLETLLQLRGRVGRVVVPRASRGNPLDPSPALCLAQLGFAVTDVDDFDVVEFEGGRVIATPFVDEDGAADVRAKSTYCVQLADASVFLGSDAGGGDPLMYRQIREFVGPLDLALLCLRPDTASPMPLYAGAPQRRGIDAAHARAALAELDADEAYVYGAGEEVWQRHITGATGMENTYRRKQVEELIGWCSDRGITAEQLYPRREWRW
jgi:L-ascorbate metabolism protein UlaG (beta-lactamase superfamily)